MTVRHCRAPRSSIRCALLTLTAFALASCSSPEQRAKSYYEHGKQLLAAHDNPRAEIEFLNAVKYDKKLLPAWRGLAQVEELTHNWKNLIPALRNILELDPSDMTTRIKLGRLLLVAGDFNGALQLVNDVKGADSQNTDLLALKGAILLKLNDSAGAVAAAKEALKVDAANTGALMVLAANDFTHGDSKGALDILNGPAMGNRTDLGIELFKLQIFEKSQDLPQAEAVLQKLVGLYPKEARFKQALIRLYLAQHRNDDAEKVQRDIVAADPKNAQAQLGLVRLLNTTRGPAAAQQQLVALIKGGGDIFPYQIALAQLNFTQGKAADAIAALKQIIGDSASAPDHVLTARINLAEMYLNQKKIDAADPIVSDILAKDARNISGLRLRATIRLDRGQFDGAISDLRQALNDQPRAIDLMLLLASAYERSGSVDLAGKEYADAMQTSNFNPAVGLNYVGFLQRRRSLSRAEDVLTDLAARWPKNIQVLSALAQIRLARQEWTGAQQVADAIKKLGNNPTAADELLGAALAGQSKFGESIAAMQNAYLSAPANAQPLQALVRTYIVAKKIPEGIAFLQSVIKANPANADAYVLLGSLQIANKAPDLAEQSFMSAIARQPANPVGYRSLIEFYIAQKKFDQALKVAQDGLKAVPNDFALQLAVAQIAERTGDYNGAISQYQSMLDKNPGAVVVINNLASLLADNRTDQASLDQAKKLVKDLQNSSVPQFKDTVGWVDYRSGDDKAALPLVEAAATALPNDPSVHYHLGMIYVAAGQAGKATEQFKIALGKAPNQELEQKIRAAAAKISSQ